MWRLIVLLLILLGCNAASPPPATQVVSGEAERPPALQVVSGDAGQTRAFFKELLKSRSYWPRDIFDHVQQEIAAKNLDKATLLRGTLELVQSSAKEERRQAIRFLGRLQDPSAIDPLVKALDNPNEDVRKEICYALHWLHAKGEPAEPVLIKLRRADAAVAVRVAAALTLERPEDPEAVAAFELGLRSDDDWVREQCEDELEKIGKLQLPLPEEIYKRVGNKDEVPSGMRVRIVRQVQKGDTLFFEVEEGHPDGIPTFHYWYRMKVASDQSKPYEVRVITTSLPSPPW